MLWTRCPRCRVPPAASQPCAALPAALNSKKGEREGENKRKKDKGGDANTQSAVLEASCRDYRCL